MTTVEILPDPMPSPEWYAERDALEGDFTVYPASFDRAAWARAETIAKNAPRCKVCAFPLNALVSLETSLAAPGCGFSEMAPGMWRHA